MGHMSGHPDDAAAYIEFLERDLNRARFIVTMLLDSSPPPLVTHQQMAQSRARAWLDGPT